MDDGISRFLCCYFPATPLSCHGQEMGVSRAGVIGVWRGLVMEYLMMSAMGSCVDGWRKTSWDSSCVMFALYHDSGPIRRPWESSGHAHCVNWKNPKCNLYSDCGGCTAAQAEGLNRESIPVYHAFALVMAWKHAPIRSRTCCKANKRAAAFASHEHLPDRVRNSGKTNKRKPIGISGEGRETQGQE
jgi:hypothetical protein